ncbi:MAG: hypothetical protein JSV05_10130 [Candidatus Bathyarchaeota archaeon]|nr:MAG: hypothetical protein JSV05_10130 [Candidatus Bathyarchaeota archaeon]
MNYSKEFSSMLSEAIQEGLSIICSSAASSILLCLKSDEAIESPSKIERLTKFSQGLDDIFGFGSKIIEKQILEVLYLKLQLPPTIIPDKFRLVEEVDKAFDQYTSNT